MSIDAGMTLFDGRNDMSEPPPPSPDPADLGSQTTPLAALDPEDLALALGWLRQLVSRHHPRGYFRNDGKKRADAKKKADAEDKNEDTLGKYASDHPYGDVYLVKL